MPEELEAFSINFDDLRVDDDGQTYLFPHKALVELKRISLSYCEQFLELRQVSNYRVKMLQNAVRSLTACLRRLPLYSMRNSQTQEPGAFEEIRFLLTSHENELRLKSVLEDEIRMTASALGTICESMESLFDASKWTGCGSCETAC